MPQFESEYEEKLYRDRLASLEKIAALGTEKLGLPNYAQAAFPNSFPFTHTIPRLRALGDPKSSEDLEGQPFEAAIAGRIMAIRAQGKAGFAQLQQGGQRIQIYVRKDDVGEHFFELYKLLHIGDHIGVRGTLMRTRTGELTLKAHPLEGQPPIVFLAKAMLALPDKYHGLEDVELRYRQRYVDLIMNSGTRPQQEQAAAASTASPANRGASENVVAPAKTGVEGGFSPLSVQPNQGASAPGTSAVTEAAAPNEEHNDAPRDVREVFIKRAQVLRAIRKFFDSRDYIEVETPMLHSVAGGAAARPFTTHHNALDMPLFLRIAPELFLKRLVVGGLDRVYEINRNFRNEGVSTRHNPEFTMLEFYQAYANYHDLMDLTEELIKFVAMEVNGTTVAHFSGNEIDLNKWQKLSMREAIVKFWPQEATLRPSLSDFASEEAFRQFLTNADEELSDRYHFMEFDRSESGHARRAAAWPLLRQIKLIANTLDANQPKSWKDVRSPERIAARKAVAQALMGKGIAEIFELLAEPHLIQPTMIYDFPLAVSPLSKIKPDEPEWVERFEFYIGGFEVGNAFSELNDAADQERRFEAQVADKDPESMAQMDEDYVRALGYGLPPTAGEGIGIDRLTMVLTGSRSIRDVILFPLMRPQAKAPVANEQISEHGESAE